VSTSCHGSPRPSYHSLTPFVNADNNRSCAIQRFIKSPKCYACGAPTQGIFNKAEKILSKLEAKRDRQREERGYKPEDGGIEIGGGGGGDDDGESGGGMGGASDGEDEEVEEGWKVPEQQAVGDDYLYED